MVVVGRGGWEFRKEAKAIVDGYKGAQLDETTGLSVQDLADTF